ncbi:hypothetical protein CFAM422_001985 [Trichoderma lentiforme]|uniref:Uncharacterized protein n=1 Tax=Trichoderma lentiforme TaxID=1567552 RepID=A0A9P5CFM4_9HYPO|nr:hypothetical protein CFAM422_001985 [Trichoderma lentiforme]
MPKVFHLLVAALPDTSFSASEKPEFQVYSTKDLSEASAAFSVQKPFVCKLKRALKQQNIEGAEFLRWQTHDLARHHNELLQQTRNLPITVTTPDFSWATNCDSHLGYAAKVNALKVRHLDASQTLLGSSGWTFRRRDRQIAEPWTCIFPYQSF